MSARRCKFCLSYHYLCCAMACAYAACFGLTTSAIEAGVVAVAVGVWIIAASGMLWVSEWCAAQVQR